MKRRHIYRLVRRHIVFHQFLHLVWFWFVWDICPLHWFLLIQKWSRGSLVHCCLIDFCFCQLLTSWSALNVHLMCNVQKRPSEVERSKCGWVPVPETLCACEANPLQSANPVTGSLSCLGCRCERLARYSLEDISNRKVSSSKIFFKTLSDFRWVLCSPIWCWSYSLWEGLISNYIWDWVIKCGAFDGLGPQITSFVGPKIETAPFHQLRITTRYLVLVSGFVFLKYFAASCLPSFPCWSLAHIVPWFVDVTMFLPVCVSLVGQC